MHCDNVVRKIDTRHEISIISTDDTVIGPQRLRERVCDIRLRAHFLRVRVREVSTQFSRGSVVEGDQVEGRLILQKSLRN